MIGDSEGPPEGDARKIVELDLKYETMRELQNELAPLLSNDGLFIPGQEPVETDSVVRFRVMLPDEFTLIEGTGVVVWKRGVGDEQGPPGVAVRWASLPSETQETIDAIIDAHLASGGVLFNLEPDSKMGESFPTDALDHRSLDERETVRREPVSAADALGDLERARLEIRGGFDPVPPAEAGEGAGESLEDDYLASVEAQVQAAIASVRDQVTHVTEPVDPELMELTTDVDESAAAAAADTPEQGTDSGSEAEGVIPDFLDKWRHEVEAESGEGGKTERLDFEPTVEDAAADETPVQETAAGGDELVMVERETQEPPRRARPWWLVPLGVVIAVGVVGYVVWLWSLSGDAPEPILQAVEQAVEPSEEVVDVTVEQLPESEFEGVEEVEAAPPPAQIPQPSLGPATVIDSITWSPSADGTEVVLRGNGTIAESTVETFGLSEPPRILVRIREIQQEYSSYELPVGTPEVERIRIGHHPELTPPALYVVLDLARPDARVTGVAAEGDTVLVTVQ